MKKIEGQEIDAKSYFFRIERVITPNCLGDGGI